MRNALIVILFIVFSFHSIAQAIDTNQIVGGSLIIKVKENFKDKCNKSAINISEFQTLSKELNISNTQKIFPNHKGIKRTKTNAKLVDLSTIYRISFDKSIDPFKLINRLKSESYILYVEPEYTVNLAYDPVDTINYNQWYLEAIQAFKAWDIQKGDTNVVIGVTDTGSDIDHEDLVDAFAYNYNDPINGVDDDNDGYIDNFNGWDVANNDNNTQSTNSGHGTNVAGIASASTDNTVGISGTGFNTRILSVRIDEESTGRLTAAYEGLIYAADHGAFIINNSWGSYNFSQFAQDAVNYAAINKGSLVICAVGNGPFSGPNAGVGVEDRFYPAAYENVFSVGAIIEGDTVKASSNYGYWVDVFAPGEAMFTTTPNGGYGYNGGTSMAAPVVAGVAALVKSEFPNYTAEQVKQRIINTSTNINGVNDPKYQDKLGSGKINAYQALVDSTTPGIALRNRVITDLNDDTFIEGDTLRIYGDFFNYLADASNVTASIRSIDDKLEIIDGNISLGNISNLDSKSNENDPFLLKVKSGISLNETIDLELTINATNYSVKRYFNLTVNPSYLTVRENNLTVTLTSNGRLGYAEPNGALGEGFRYLGGNSMLYEGSFIIGTSESYCPNAFRADIQTTDDDFKIIRSIRNVKTSKADYEAIAVFNDQNTSNPPQFEIQQRSYFFSTGESVNSVVFVFGIKNLSNNPISNIHAGLIADWDIIDFANNKVTYDPTRKMGISYSTDSNIFCGVRSLTDLENNFHYAIDNTQNGIGGIDITDGFSDAEKFQSISNNRDSAGNSSPKGNDIIDVNSIGPLTIKADSVAFVSFAITIAESLKDLETESDSVSLLFEQLSLRIYEDFAMKPNGTFVVYPNPTQQTLNIKFNSPSAELGEISIFDTNGKLVYLKEQSFSAGEQNIALNLESWKTGVYFLKITGKKMKFQNTFVVSP